jgi:hypothetical protein
MPKTSKAKLAYMAEYQARPENVAKRVARNKARREAIREGAVSKGDGKEIDHKVPLDKGGSNTKDNRRVTDASENRAWRAKHGSMYGKSK